MSLQPSAKYRHIRLLTDELKWQSYAVFDLKFAYGEGDGPENRSVLQLPFVRLLYAGAPMVSIFFVVSAYALSIKPISQMRSGAHADLLRTLSSAAFRRFFRLFLPCFCSTFLVLILVQLGLYDYTRRLYEDKSRFREIPEDHAVRLATFTQQCWDWLHSIWEFVHVWGFAVYGGLWHLLQTIEIPSPHRTTVGSDV